MNIEEFLFSTYHLHNYDIKYGVANFASSGNEPLIHRTF